MGTTAEKLQKALENKRLIVNSVNAKAGTTYDINSKPRDIANTIINISSSSIPEGYIKPSGSIDIVDTQEYDVTQYAKAQIKDENLKAENIAENVTVLGIVGTHIGGTTGTDTSDATATADDILLGKTAYVNDTKIEGTIETYDYSNSEEVSPEIDKLILNEITDYYNDRVTEIGANVFFGNSVLKSVDFPNVTIVKNSAFANTQVLTGVNLPICQIIYNAGFQQVKALEKISLPKIKTLYVAAFSTATKLKKVYLGNDLTEIQAQTFYGNTSLEYLIIDSEKIPSLGNVNALGNCAKATFYVRDAFVEEIESKTNWSTYASQIKGISELPQEIKEEFGL